MANNSIAGINVAIGADLSDLKTKMGEVGTAIKNGIEPGKQPVKDLADQTKKASTAAGTAKANFQQIAAAVERIGSAVVGWTKGMIEEAIKINPDTAAAVEGVKGSFDEMKKAVADSLSPAIQEVAPIITGLFSDITKWVSENPETATTILAIAGGIGAMASAAGAAAPLLLLFNISLAPISGTALLVVGGITAMIGVLALLSSSLDEIGAKAEQTAEQLATMDTTTQHIVETGTGELKIEDRDIFWSEADVYDPTTHEYGAGWAYIDESTGRFVKVSDEVAAAVNGTTESVAEMDTALTDAADSMETASDSVEETKSTAEQAQEIFDSLQESLTGTTETLTGEGSFTEAMDQVSQILESEAFKQFSKEPLDESVSTSWSSFSDSINAASDGFSTLSTELNGNTASEKIADISGEALAAADAFAVMAEQINAVIGALAELNRHGTPSLGSGTNGSTDVFKAAGGPVKAGHGYIVGEYEPEFFVPETDGEIVPMSSVSNSNTYNFGNVYGESYLKRYVTGIVSGVIRKELRRAA